LTFAFYHLAQRPEQVEKLRAELRGCDLSIASLRDLPHLNGIINETLRMHPPVPSGVLRQTPPEGLHINEHFIPGNVTVGIPTYAISRSERCYERPNEWVPERWYEKTEMVREKGAFAPFSLGPYGCIGKQLALMELRTVIAELVTKFDVKFAAGETGRNLIEKTEDYFTLGLADLNCEFTARKV